MTINTTVLWKLRDSDQPALDLPLYCEDFDLIFNNPVAADYRQQREATTAAG